MDKTMNRQTPEQLELTVFFGWTATAGPALQTRMSVTSRVSTVTPELGTF
uniref:Uncharacterized protein n=1 Tax=Anguilla anguilla TaxID=7936 RepID=A0A0E9SVH6_ANGAN